MVNHVVLVGNLGSDPEVRTFGDQQKVTRLSVATHEVVKKRTGEREKQTEWHQSRGLGCARRARRKAPA